MHFFHGFFQVIGKFHELIAAHAFAQIGGGNLLDIMGLIKEQELETGDDLSGRVYFDDLRLVKKSTAPLQIAGYDNAIPTKFQLYQNYPNPFNPSTTIAFDIPENGMVKLTIYDVLGREIKTLINDRMMPGHHEYRFDPIASGLASGVYIYRVSMNDKAMSKRMLLLK